MRTETGGVDVGADVLGDELVYGPQLFGGGLDVFVGRFSPARLVVVEHRPEADAAEGGELGFCGDVDEAG